MNSHHSVNFSTKNKFYKIWKLQRKITKKRSDREIDKNQRMTHINRKITDWSILNSKGKTFLLEEVTLELRKTNFRLPEKINGWIYRSRERSFDSLSTTWVQTCVRPAVGFRGENFRMRNFNVTGKYQAWNIKIKHQTSLDWAEELVVG